MDAGSQLMFPVVFSPSVSPPHGAGLPTIRVSLPTSITQSRKLSHTCPEVFLIGDSKPCPDDKQY